VLFRAPDRKSRIILSKPILQTDKFLGDSQVLVVRAEHDREYLPNADFIVVIAEVEAAEQTAVRLDCFD
jgi:hypothetical protein